MMNIEKLKKANRAIESCIDRMTNCSRESTSRPRLEIARSGGVDVSWMTREQDLSLRCVCEWIG